VQGYFSHLIHEAKTGFIIATRTRYPEIQESYVAPFAKIFESVELEFVNPSRRKAVA
jgi:hypothetical protein